LKVIKGATDIVPSWSLPRMFYWGMWVLRVERLASLLLRLAGVAQRFLW
jgi:hypothetical protein